MKHSIIGSLALVIALAGTAVAGSHTAPDGSSVYAPDSFKIDKAAVSSEGIMIATSRAEDCVFMYALAKGENLDKAVAAFDALIDNVVKDGKLGKASKTTLNGMPAIAVTGTGVAEGKPVSLGAVIVKTSDTHALIVVGIVETTKKGQYKGELQKVLASIKRK